MAYPPMISYAQNGEDVVLRRVFFDRDSPGFYIDIGACHPTEDNVTAHFYERGWRGINVEPDPDLFGLFPAARPRDINVNVAIDSMSTFTEFFPMKVRGHGTLDAGYAAKEVADDVSIKVPAVKLSDLIDQHVAPGQEFAFLKIDVEGWERQVICGMDWKRCRPQIILIEAVDIAGRPNHDSWEETITSAGYRFALFDGLNRFYCREEDAERLMPLLSSPANVFDNWVRNSQVRLEQAKDDALRAKTLALDAVSLKAAELERAQQETARALERERIAEESLADLELRLRVEAEISAQKREAELAGRRRVAGFLGRMLLRSRKSREISANNTI